MKKIVCKRGNVNVEIVPDPVCSKNEIIVKNIASVISVGTEKDSISVRKKSPLKILKDRPDLKKHAMGLVKSAGLINAYKMGMQTLKEPIALGYSCAGIVLKTGEDVSSIKSGDYVACMGLGASHAEFVKVTENLCYKLPGNVSFEEGAFGTLGAIALQGIRRADVSIGENIAVIGLGLIGNLTLQILKVSGCNVVGFDLNEYKINFSKNYCDNAYHVKKCDINTIKNTYTNGFGFDKVLITAGSQSNDPIVLALDVLRKKGTIVLVGATRIEIPREPFYKKEADFLISTSYGPGRYDPEFEDKGKYIPLEYVRWNETQNLASFLKLISDKKIDVTSLISKEFTIDEADKAFKLLNEDDNLFGLLIRYARNNELSDTVINLRNTSKKELNKAVVTVGIIGVGSFVKYVQLPNFDKLKHFQIKALCSHKGYEIKQLGEKYGVDYITSDYQKILADEDIDMVYICTRHDSHAKIAIDALKKNKHTFVEKPLAIKDKDVENVIKIAKESKGQLFIGFNRTFSPLTKIIEEEIKNVTGPRIVNYHIKTKPLPSDHWTIDLDKGGGRIIGEMVHFIDYLNYIIKDEPIEINAYNIETKNKTIKTIDDVNVTLKYKNGSVGNIIYSSVGANCFPKETVYLHAGAKSFQIDDFKTLYIYDNKLKKKKWRNQDKGHVTELKQVNNSLKTGNVLFDLNKIYLTHKIAFKILEMISKGNEKS